MKINETLINVGILDNHVDMFFQNLLQNIILDYKKHYPEIQYEDISRKFISKKFDLISRVILYDSFHVKVDNIDIKEIERDIVKKEYLGHYNYSDEILVDLMMYADKINREEIHGEIDDYLFSQQCVSKAYVLIAKRILEDRSETLFKHYLFEFDKRLVIHLSIFGMYSYLALYKKYKEDKLKELIEEYLSSFNIIFVEKEETTIDFNSEMVLGLQDSQLISALPEDIFSTFNFDDSKFCNGVFWIYNKSIKENFSSWKSHNIAPLYCLLDDPIKTLLLKNQVFLKYSKI